MRKLINYYRNLSEWPKKVFHNMNWLFLDVTFRMWVSFFVWTWIARYFWPNDFWVYNYALAFVWIFSFIANLWLDSITIKELVDKPEDNDQILWSVFLLKILWGFVTVLFINLISYFLFYKSFIQFIIIFIISLWYIFQSFNVINLYFQSKVEWKYNVIASWIWFFVSNLLKVYIILKWLWIVYLAFAYLIDFIISGWVYLIIYIKHIWVNKFKWKINRKIIKIMFLKWVPLALSSIAAYVFLRIDQIMIWNMMSSKEVWLYSVSVIISDSTFNIFGIVSSSLFPALIASKKINTDIYFRRLKMYYSLFFIISLLLIFPIFIFSKHIILFLFWENYFESIIVLKIYILSVFPVAFTFPLYQYMTNERVISYSLYSIVFWAILSIIMNFFLIPRYWLIWAAFSTTIPSVLSLLIYFFFKKTRNIIIFSIKSFNPYYLLKYIYMDRKNI